MDALLRLGALERHTIATTRVDIAHGIGVDSVGKSIITVGEDLSIVQPLAVIRYIEFVDICRTCRVVLTCYRRIGGSADISDYDVSSKLRQVISIWCEVSQYWRRFSRRTWKRVRPCVCNIYVLVVWTEFKTIGGNEVIGYSLNDTCVGFEAIDLRPNGRLRSKVLPISIASVSEPQVARDRMLLDVVDRREVAP